MAALHRMTLQVKSSNRRRSSILFSKLSDAGLSEVLNSALLVETSSQADENQNIEQTLSDLEFYYGLGKQLESYPDWSIRIWDGYISN